MFVVTQVSRPTGSAVCPAGQGRFETSLFPKDGRYLLPLKDAVRKPQQITVGDEITVDMTVR